MKSEYSAIDAPVSVCRQCLLRETAESGTWQTIKEYLDRMPEDERAADSVYERRLSVCCDCAFLNAASCMLCGCYVELRAAVKSADCPHIPSRWERNE